MSRGLKEHKVIKQNKELRCGFTTGSCAAAAAKGAAAALLLGTQESNVSLLTPAGIRLFLPLEDFRVSDNSVSCCVTKDAGDDPDVTDGIHIYAEVKKIPSPGISIEGGEGIGRITRKGLFLPVGEAAINPVPREMITDAVREVLDRSDYEGGLLVTVRTPEGGETAKKTFNPRLGIEGGISILGTTGIVEPMSEAAMVKSIEAEMRILLAEGNGYLLVTPGNYGADYVKTHCGISGDNILKCSNFVGDTIDMAVNLKARGLLFVSHIGKFIKLAGGIMNTHSREADCRAELMAAAAVRSGAGLKTVREILQTKTTEEGISLLKSEGILERTMEDLLEKIGENLSRRAYDRLLTGALVFSGGHGFLGQTKHTDLLWQKLKETE